jgi:sec-independent protein translocase protein TatA
MGYENLLLIVIAAGLILFGSKKLPELFRSVGRAQVEYEKARAEAKHEIDKIQHTNSNSSSLTSDSEVGKDIERAKLEEMASKLNVENPSCFTNEELKEKILQRIRP